MFVLMEKSFAEGWGLLGNIFGGWKNTGQFTSIYFAFICLLLKGALLELGQVPCGSVLERNRLVATYNELVGVAKSVGETFH